MLGCACLGCGSNRNPESYLHWQQSTSVVSDVACCPKHVPITTQQTPQVLCTNHDSKLSPGICCVASAVWPSAVWPSVVWIPTSKPRHKSHFKDEAWCMSIWSPDMCCPLCLWCLLCGYPHNLCHNCYKQVLCHLCLWCLWCLLPAPAALNPIGGRHTSAVGCTPGAQARCDSR